MKKRMNELEEQIKILEDKITVEEYKKQKELSYENVVAYLQKAIQLKPKPLILTLIQKIVVYDDRLEIFFNYTKEIILTILLVRIIFYQVFDLLRYGGDKRTRTVHPLECHSSALPDELYPHVFAGAKRPQIFTCLPVNYSPLMAPTGQAFFARAAIDADVRIDFIMRVSLEIALTGQVSAHAPQLMQSSEILCAIAFYLRYFYNVSVFFIISYLLPFVKLSAKVFLKLFYPLSPVNPFLRRPLLRAVPSPAF